MTRYAAQGGRSFASHSTHTVSSYRRAWLAFLWQSSIPLRSWLSMLSGPAPPDSCFAIHVAVASLLSSGSGAGTAELRLKCHQLLRAGVRDLHHRVFVPQDIHHGLAGPGVDAVEWSIPPPSRLVAICTAFRTLPLITI